jgi:L-fuculose-phosphate aldolase
MLVLIQACSDAKEAIPMNRTTELARQELISAVRLLFTTGVMAHAGHANLSARLEDGRMLLTVRGVVRDLTPEQLAVVGFGGERVEGELEPTTAEIVPMHAEVYRLREDFGAVIHTHSPHVTAFALAHQPLPCRYEALLRFGQAEEIPVVPWAPRGSPESVSGITDALKRHPQTHAVLLANHGLLAFGSGPSAAARLVVAMEEAAEAELRAAAIGGARDFPAGALRDVRRSMVRAGSSTP